jgi:protein-tyrosine phosphatase
MKKTNVLFVCLGNICRSPSAEAVMQSLVEQAGLSDQIFCDSAGTSGEHDGENADPRSIAHGKKRNYELKSISRKFVPKKDFQFFDYIVTMDDLNYRDIKNLDRNNEFSEKIFKMVEFGGSKMYPKVPDPYYGGPEGFDEVLDILEETCAGLLQKIKSDKYL